MLMASTMVAQGAVEAAEAVEAPGVRTSAGEPILIRLRTQPAMRLCPSRRRLLAGTFVETLPA